MKGVKPFHVMDEFYYKATFVDHGVTPLLRIPELPADPKVFPGAPAEPKEQVTVWAFDRPGTRGNKIAGRSIGATLGHYYANWQNDDYRKLLLNAIVWTAHIPVPKAGVESTWIDVGKSTPSSVLRPPRSTPRSNLRNGPRSVRLFCVDTPVRRVAFGGEPSLPSWGITEVTSRGSWCGSVRHKRLMRRMCGSVRLKRHKRPMCGSCAISALCAIRVGLGGVRAGPRVLCFGPEGCGSSSTCGGSPVDKTKAE
jgi:hypothetical protein